MRSSLYMDDEFERLHKNIRLGLIIVMFLGLVILLIATIVVNR